MLLFVTDNGFFLKKLLFSDEGISLLSFDTALAGDDLPLFTFSSIKSATENFSTANKLGEGGFGPVYKVKFLLHLMVFEYHIFANCKS